LFPRLLFTVVLLFLAIPAFAVNGYQDSLTWWNEVVRNASQYSVPLQNLYAEVEAQVGPDKSQLTQAFSKRLAQQYPGSSFYGPFGTLAVNGYTQLTFDSAWNILVLRQQLGGLHKSYDFRDQSVEVANGPNRVKFKLHPQRPQLSTFTVVDIPAISASAHRLWAKMGHRQGLFQPSKEILNEAYASRIAMVDGTRMDKLAEAMVEDEATRQQVLGIADALYSKRPAESVAATRPVVSTLPTSQPAQPPQPITQAPPRPDLFKALPGYFWPALLFIGTLKVLTAGSRREDRKRGSRAWGRAGGYPRGQPTPSYSWWHRVLPWYFRPLIQPMRAVWGWFNAKEHLALSQPSLGDTAEDFSLGGDQNSSDEFVLSQPPVTPKPETPKEWTLQVLHTLEWKRFETVCAEYLRMIGYDPRETSIGPDGGIDIWVYKQGSEKAVGIVQCKAWKSYKVGVKPVRELYGVMAAEGVRSGKFITTGEFTTEARSFAEGKRLELISGEKFLAAIRRMSAEKQGELLASATQGDYRTPTCPQCGVKMTLKQGQGQWRDFWGCPKYPRCKATLTYRSEEA